MECYGEDGQEVAEGVVGYSPTKRLNRNLFSHYESISEVDYSSFTHTILEDTQRIINHHRGLMSHNNVLPSNRKWKLKSVLVDGKYQ